MVSSLWSVSVASNQDFAQAIASCDAIYATRSVASSQALFKAEECYRQLWAPSLSEDQKLELLERAMINLSVVVNHFAKTPEEKTAVAKAFEWLELYKSFIEKTAEYKYWIAVWVSFDAMILDRGAVLPRNLFRNLKFIQTQLRNAIELKPTLHAYGPHRVLGLMHSQMPGIVGGDKVLAERLLRESVENAPMMSANWVGYATILNINGKYDEAKRVLRTFLGASLESLEPYGSIPHRSLRFEIELDQKKGQELLNELESNSRR